ncbi:hypothetical protein BaRGS_00015599 [Batillaria attramentaria]|uniref:Uncharacterized protein n=1 Tax=Batillaria attramentaria TaxID=370345 RepID=A0ABD0L1A2_9CAEN
MTAAQTGNIRESSFSWLDLQDLSHTPASVLLSPVCYRAQEVRAQAYVTTVCVTSHTETGSGYVEVVSVVSCRDGVHAG